MGSVSKHARYVLAALMVASRILAKIARDVRMGKSSVSAAFAMLACMVDFAKAARSVVVAVMVASRILARIARRRNHFKHSLC